MSQEGTQTLSGGTIEANMDRAIWQTGLSVAFGDLVTENRANGTVDVDDFGFDLDWCL